MINKIEYVESEKPKPDLMFKSLQKIYFLGCLNISSLYAAIYSFYLEKYVLFGFLILLFIGTFPPTKKQFEWRNKFLENMKK